jgi:hypothetical protein
MSLELGYLEHLNSFKSKGLIIGNNFYGDMLK